MSSWISYFLLGKYDCHRLVLADCGSTPESRSNDGLDRQSCPSGVLAYNISLAGDLNHTGRQ